MQLIVNTVLFLLGLLQFAVVLDEIPDNESQHNQTSQCCQQNGPVHLSERAEDLIVIAYHSNLPVGFLLDGGIIDIPLRMVFRVAECGNLAPAILARFLGYATVVNDADDMFHVSCIYNIGVWTGDQLSILGQQQIER